MNYKLKLPVTIDPYSVKDITDSMLVDIFLMKQDQLPTRLDESQLRVEAIKNLTSGNLYFYTAICKVGKKNVEYKYQSGEEINSYSLFYLN
jgi:hypothetical protein